MVVQLGTDTYDLWTETAGQSFGTRGVAKRRAYKWAGSTPGPEIRTDRVYPLGFTDPALEDIAQHIGARLPARA